MEVASIALRCTHADFQSKGELPTLTIDLVVAISVAGALVAEHRRAAQGSALMGIQLALGILLESTKSRFYLRHIDTVSIGRISAASAVVRGVLLVLAELPRGAAFVDGQMRRPAGREASTGFWTRTLLLWLNSTIFLGFRRQLRDDDLGSIGPEFSSEALSRHFKHYWQSAHNLSQRRLAMACFWALRKSIMAVALPRLLFAVCLFLQPFLVQRILAAAQSESLSDYSKNSLMQSFCVVFFGIAAARASFQHMNCRLITQLRGTLVAEIIDKSQMLPQSEALKSVAVTLMTVDIEAIMEGAPLLHEIPFNVLEIVIGMFCLARFVERACLVIVGPLIFSVTLGPYMARKSTVAWAVWSESIEHRVTETATVLSQLKVIKVMGLGPIISAYLHNLREKEIASSRRYYGLRAVTAASQMFAATMPPVLVVGAGLFWTSFMGKLSTVEVFPCLATVALIQRPLHELLFSAAKVANMFASLDRIEEYLELDERDEPRVLVDPRTNLIPDDGTNAVASSTPTIEFVDVTLLNHDSEAEVIRNASFTIARGSITAALGPSGCGKSALLQSLVGDANVADGFIYVDDGTVGYADQTPWIRNVSIRENVVGALLFDADWYFTVMRVCLLLEDLIHLAGGDNYIAGTNGMNLSGGQRHRVALARALYCRASTVILDDIFSALDRKTAVSILFQLCGEEGLLRRAGCTVIIATYLAECLDVADQLLLIDSSGNVALETDFKQEWFRATLVKALNSKPLIMSTETEDEEKAAILRARELQNMIPLTPSATATSTRSPGTNVRMYSFFINSIGKKSFAIWACLVFMVSFTEMVPDIFIRIWISVAPDNMLFFAGYAASAMFATAIYATVNLILFLRLAPRCSIGLHEQITDVLMRSTLFFFSCTDTGSILGMYSQDMGSIIRDLPGQTLRFLYMMFHIILQTAAIVPETTHMITIVPSITLSIGVVLSCYLRASRQLHHMDKETKTPLYNHFTETARGLRHIRALGWASFNFNSGLALLDASQRPFYIVRCMKRWLGLMLDLLTCGVSVSLTSLSLNHRDTIPIAGVGLSYLILITFGIALEYFVDSCENLDNTVHDLSRLQAFINRTPTEPDLGAVDLPPNWPNQGRVEMRNVTARYSFSASSVFRNISLDVAPGKKVGITGRTGSGKSSLFLSMLGFLDYTGTIEIDGVDISTIPRDFLRSRVITISQDYLDLGGSVRNNLLPFELNLPSTERGPITDTDMNDVLRRVGLLALIDRHGGLDAELKRVGLSHGQLQLLSIARAILRGIETQSKVVLMDEATSNVDAETDTTIQRVLRESFAGCTIFMIAHRQQTVQDANLFVELTQGEASVVPGSA